MSQGGVPLEEIARLARRRQQRGPPSWSTGKRAAAGDNDRRRSDGEDLRVGPPASAEMRVGTPRYAGIDSTPAARLSSSNNKVGAGRAPFACSSSRCCGRSE